MKKKHIYFSLSFMVFIISEIFSQETTPKTIQKEEFLVKNGLAVSEIIISDKPTRSVRLAAKELQNYIYKISGAKLPVTSIPNSVYPAKIYVGRSIFTENLGLRTEILQNGAFQIASGENWLALLGEDKDFHPKEPWPHSREDRIRAQKEWDSLTGEKWEHPMYLLFKKYNKEIDLWTVDEYGSLTAVYSFLEDLGVRWYMPCEIGEIIPALKTITLPRINKVLKADTPLRYLCFYKPFSSSSKDEALWRLRLGLYEDKNLLCLSPFGHGTCLVHGRDEIKKLYPEYFALWNGRATGEGEYGKPCLSSIGLFEANLKYARTLFDYYDEKVISVMPADGYSTLCRCELCKGKDTPERGRQGILSDYVWDYVNRVAAELYKTHPDRKVLCFAYGSYLLPPEKIDKLSPNIVVGIAQWRSLFYDNDTFKRFENLRNDWAKKISTEKIYIYDYYLHARPGREWEGIPAVFPHLISKDIHSLKGKSYGEIIEIYDTGNSLAINHLNIYITARLYWNADQNVDEILSEYYRLFYGPAQNEMKNFYAFCERNWPSMKSQISQIDKAMEFLDAARKQTGDSIYEKRIDMIIAWMKKGRERLLDKGKKIERTNVPRAIAYKREVKSLKLDGKLDDTFWEGLPAHQLRDLKTKKTENYKTSFKIAWDGDCLYLGVYCEDHDSKNLNITASKNDDTGIWFGDNIDIFFETPPHSYYQITVNPAGMIADADRQNDTVNLNWTSNAAVSVYTGDGFWSAEIKIPMAGETAIDANPLNGVAGKRPSKSQLWYFNVCRQRARNGKTTHSAFSPGKNFSDLSKFSELITK